MQLLKSGVAAGFALAVAILSPLALSAAPPKTLPATKETTVRETGKPVKYVAPNRSAPGGRTYAGSRGAERDVFVLTVLAPDHTGLTTQEQPSLFWFVSTQTAMPIEITVADPDQVKPLLRVRLNAPVAAGIHRVRLADHGVRLQRDVAYKWYVMAVADESRRSKDIRSSAMIQRVDPDTALQAQMRDRGFEEMAAAYAQAGIWYDAIETLCDELRRSRDDEQTQHNLAELMRQGTLPELPAPLVCDQ